MNATQSFPSVPIVQRLLEQLPQSSQEAGSYQVETQTWSHRDAALMSPIKHQREN